MSQPRAPAEWYSNSWFFLIGIKQHNYMIFRPRGLPALLLLLRVPPKLHDQMFYHPMAIHQSVDISSYQAWELNCIRKKNRKRKEKKEITFQSPVWRMVPSAQRRTKPQQSGIEWVTRKGSISNGPAVNFFLVLNTLSLDGRKIPFSFKRFLISC